MKILLLTHKLPYPLHDGYNLHNYNYVSKLCGEHEFHLVSLGPGELPDSIASIFKSVAVVPCREPDKRQGIGRLTHALSVDEVFDFDPAVFAAIREVIEREDIELVWTAGAKMLVYSHRLSGLPVLGDIADEAAKEAMHDVKRARTPIAVARSLKNLANTWRFQKKYLGHTGICTVVSGMDRVTLSRNCPDLDVAVVPNGVDSDVFAPQGVDEVFPSLVFEGTMDFLPNKDGIQAFCRDTLPLIHAQRPDVRLFIVGKNPVPEVEALASDRVIVTGFVDDVKPWVEKSSIFVCPLLRGAGIKNKILQAWSLERPVVATTVSCGGLPLEPGVNIEIADEPQLFAKTVLELLDDVDRRRALGKAGRQTVLDKCSWDAAARTMDEVLHTLLERGPQQDYRPTRKAITL